jgi:hypothetical protein
LSGCSGIEKPKPNGKISGGRINTMKCFISRGTGISIFLLFLTSVNAQEPDKQTLSSAPARQTTSRKPKVSVPFEEKLLGTMPPEYEELAFAGLVQIGLTAMKKDKVQFSYSVRVPPVVCFSPSSKDFDLPSPPYGVVNLKSPAAGG